MEELSNEEQDREDRIAELVVKKMFEKLQNFTGKAVLDKIFWIAMIGIVAIASLLGVIHIPAQH